MVGVIEESQITLLGKFDLQVEIAVRFENSDITERFVRGFSAYTIRRGSKEKLGPPSLIEFSDQAGTVTLDNSHAIQPGISPLFYIRFHIPSFTKDDQSFEIEMEAVGQPTQRIEIVPNWSYIQPVLLYGNTVKKIRYLN